MPPAVKVTGDLAGFTRAMRAQADAVAKLGERLSGHLVQSEALRAQQAAMQALFERAGENAFEAFRRQEPALKRIAEKWRERLRRRAERSQRRAEERKRRAARRAHSKPVLSKRAAGRVTNRREELEADAALVPCDPIVLARAQLLELETTSSPALRRPGPKTTPIPVKESLEVWVLNHDEGLSPRAIENRLGISDDRVRQILKRLSD
jgi:hypothetical protein